MPLTTSFAIYPISVPCKNRSQFRIPGHMHLSGLGHVLHLGALLSLSGCQRPWKTWRSWVNYLWNAQLNSCFLLANSQGVFSNVSSSAPLPLPHCCPAPEGSCILSLAFHRRHKILFRSISDNVVLTLTTSWRSFLLNLFIAKLVHCSLPVNLRRILLGATWN